MPLPFQSVWKCGWNFKKQKLKNLSDCIPICANLSGYIYFVISLSIVDSADTQNRNTLYYAFFSSFAEGEAFQDWWLAKA